MSPCISSLCPLLTFRVGWFGLFFIPSPTSLLFRSSSHSIIFRDYVSFTPSSHFLYFLSLFFHLCHLIVCLLLFTPPSLHIHPCLPHFTSPLFTTASSSPAANDPFCLVFDNQSPACWKHQDHCEPGSTRANTTVPILDKAIYQYIWFIYEETESKFLDIMHFL